MAIERYNQQKYLARVPLETFAILLNLQAQSNKLSEYSQLQVFKHLSISISLSYAH